MSIQIFLPTSIWLKKCSRTCSSLSSLSLGLLHLSSVCPSWSKKSTTAGPEALLGVQEALKWAQGSWHELWLFLSCADSGCSGHFRKYLLQEALPVIVVRAKHAGLAPGWPALSRPRVCPGQWVQEGEEAGRWRKGEQRDQTRKKSWTRASFSFS
jgi:hypothetical protein